MTLADLTHLIVLWVGAASTVVVAVVIIWNFIEVRRERRGKQD